MSMVSDRVGFSRFLVRIVGPLPVGGGLLVRSLSSSCQERLGTAAIRFAKRLTSPQR